MGLFDMFKKKEEHKTQTKCAECFRPLVGPVYSLDNKKYCKKCYNRKMAIIQQTEGQGNCANPQTGCQETKKHQITTELNCAMLNDSQIEEQNTVRDSRCERCLNGLPESQVDQGQLNENISWKIVDNILYLSGEGALTQEDYLVITAPAPRYETVTYTHVLPWAVSYGIRKSKYISEGCPVSEIPTHIKGLVVDGEIEGLEDFLLGANNDIGIRLQSAKEYLCPQDTMTFEECADEQHHFVDLKHFTHHSECKCKKCGLIVGFNRGWSERILANEWEAFIEKYKGSKFDFFYSPND